ncbi:MAG: XrtA/PEP-CTERM system TPR-repeat protein PrsT, partial [Burkholderiaceae bacterium]
MRFQIQSYLRPGAGIFATLLALSLPACKNEDSPEALLASARSYEAKGDIKAAIIQLKNALQKRPENGEARLLLGRLSLQAGDPVSAEKELRKALEYGQTPDAVLPSLAQAMLEQGQTEKLLAELGDRKLTDPTAFATFLSSIGMAQLQLGKRAAARASFDAATALAPTLVAAQLGMARTLAAEGKFDEAMQVVDRVIVANPNAAEAYGLQADLHLIRGDSAGAKALLEKAVAANPALLPARYALIQVLINQEQFDAATAQLEEARKLRNGDLKASYFEAMIAFGRKDLAKAREAIQVVLKRAPEHVPTLVLAGAVELQGGQNAAAESYLRKAISLSPQHSGARRLLVRAYLGSNQPAKAMDSLQPLVSAGNRLDPQMQLLAGETYLANGDLKQASNFFAAASDSKQQAPIARTRLGQIALASGNPDAGIKELESVTGLEGAPMQADMALIVGYVRKNDLDKALAAANAFVKKNPQSPLAQQVLGAVYAARKDSVAARAAYSRAVELNPTYLPAIANLARLDLIDKKPADARKRFEAVVEKEPKNEMALLGLAEILTRTGAPANEISATLQKAVSANPQSTNARLALIGFYVRAKDSR